MTQTRPGRDDPLSRYPSLQMQVKDSFSFLQMAFSSQSFNVESIHSSGSDGGRKVDGRICIGVSFAILLINKLASKKKLQLWKSAAALKKLSN